LKIILYQPGEHELGLISDKALFAGASVYAILDPDNLSASAQEIGIKLGIPISISIDKDNLSEDVILVYPDNLENSASLSDTAFHLNIGKCSTTNFIKINIKTKNNESKQFKLDPDVCEFNRIDHAIAAWCCSTAMAFESDLVSVAIELPDSQLLLCEGNLEGISRFGQSVNNHPGWKFSLGKSQKLTLEDSSSLNNFTREYIPLKTSLSKSAFSIEFSKESKRKEFSEVSATLLSEFSEFIDIVITNFLSQHKLDSAIRALETILDFADLPKCNSDNLKSLFGSSEVIHSVYGNELPAIYQELLTKVKHGYAISNKLPSTLLVTDGHNFSIVFKGKTPAHQLDGDKFSEEDAFLAVKLLPTLKKILTGFGSNSLVSNKSLLVHLRKEIDRSNRYHSSFSLTMISVNTEITDLFNNLIESVRSSDLLAIVNQNTIAVIAPEESQSVSRFEKRLTKKIEEVLKSDELEIKTSRVTYPGRFNNAEELLESVLSYISDK
jgi:hypothetical protein